MNKIARVVQDCTNLPVHPRHAYAGQLVYTAFSGSHQDAINKCLKVEKEKRTADPLAQWNVAYLPIDPRDLGRDYEEVIRINSQSGKGGAAFVLERDFGWRLPQWLQVDFGQEVQFRAEEQGTEVTSKALGLLFEETYLIEGGGAVLHEYEIQRIEERDHLKAIVTLGEKEIVLDSSGKGALDSLVRALSEATCRDIVLADYSEHTLGQTEEAEAMAYVGLLIEGRRVCGVGRSRDIMAASFEAILAALSRSMRDTASVS